VGIFIKVKKAKSIKNEFLEVANNYIIEKIEKQFSIRFKDSTCSIHSNETSIITVSINQYGILKINKDFCCTDFENSLDFSLD
jgi:hypothetical protein